MTRPPDLGVILSTEFRDEEIEHSEATSAVCLSIDAGVSSDMGDIGREDDGGHTPIARDETHQVTQRKLYVWLVLVVSAVATAVGTFVYIRRSEEVAYQADFQSNAHKVLEAVGRSLEQTLKSLDALTASIVSHAHATNQSWPFVTMPDFTLQAAKTISLGDVVFMAILPLVTNETRHKWEEYSVDHDRWTNTSVQLQSEYNLYHGTLDLAYESVNVIWGDFGDIDYNVTRDFLPQWQSYPNVNTDNAAVYNFDWLSISSVDAPKTAVYKHHMVISEAYLLPDPNDPVDVAETEIWTEWMSDFVQPGEPYDEPASDLYFPIFDQLEQIRAPSSVIDGEEYDPSIHDVVGTLVSSLQWRNLIVDILPPGSDGVIVVFENHCNPTFTYQINGPSAIYLGRGDLHDIRYDDDRITSRLVDLNSFAVGTGSLYSGPPVDTEFCPFTIHVYGSHDMHKNYTNNDPGIFAVVAVMIFVFTSFVFCFYDYTVEMRQKKVLTTAEASNAIVASLFPEQVREQLVYAVQTRTKASSQRNDTSKSRMDKFLEEAFLVDDDRSPSATMSSPPIATLYPETTVMFADIAGFTKWSSTREPVAVFTLLENLYGAFDAIAKRRRVFKVETIGDCYVAVAGLPKAEPKHAVVMAKFAMDCRKKMTEVTRELSATLGSDTGLLFLRVGLHSGPTTAGVLRGDKSRFQLFGDTVNTASRMESTGTPNKIHISQSTADLLTAADKASWMTKRKEPIEAKGKGTMQTYWVSPTSSTESMATASSDSDSVIAC